MYSLPRMLTHSKLSLLGLLLAAGCAKPGSPSFEIGPGGLVVAPALGTVAVTPNLDSAVLEIPRVPGAVDYRAFAFTAGASAAVNAGGGEQINGSVVYCAGFRQ